MRICTWPINSSVNFKNFVGLVVLPRNLPVKTDEYRVKYKEKLKGKVLKLWTAVDFMICDKNSVWAKSEF